MWKGRNVPTELDVTRNFILTRKLYHHEVFDLEYVLCQLLVPDVNSVSDHKLKTKVSKNNSTKSHWADDTMTSSYCVVDFDLCRVQKWGGLGVDVKGEQRGPGWRYPIASCSSVRGWWDMGRSGRWRQRGAATGQLEHTLNARIPWTPDNGLAAESLIRPAPVSRH